MAGRHFVGLRWTAWGRTASSGRALRRGFAIVLAALLEVGLIASPAWATVPSAPPPPSVSAGVGQITVTFSAPASNGGHPITAYTALCYPTTSSTAIPGSASNSGAVAPIVVAGLTNGAAYVCIGHGDERQRGRIPNRIPPRWSSSAPPRHPPSPSRRPAMVRSPWRSARRRTTAARSGSYTASCTSSTGVPGSNTGAVSPIVITVLTNGAGYTCTVTATNAFGTSAPSPPSAPRHPVRLRAASPRRRRPSGSVTPSSASSSARRRTTVAAPSSATRRAASAPARRARMSAPRHPSSSPV